jgi:hypothetical protein
MTCACSGHYSLQTIWIHVESSMAIIERGALTALSVSHCNSRHAAGKFHTNLQLTLKIFKCFFSLQSASVVSVTTCAVSLWNCDTALSANSVNLNDLISAYDWLHMYLYTYIYTRKQVYVQFQAAGCTPLQKTSAWQFLPAVQLNTQQQQLLCNYCKYSSIAHLYSLCLYSNCAAR